MKASLFLYETKGLKKKKRTANYLNTQKIQTQLSVVCVLIYLLDILLYFTRTPMMMTVIIISHVILQQIQTLPAKKIEDYDGQIASRKNLLICRSRQPIFSPQFASLSVYIFHLVLFIYSFCTTEIIFRIFQRIRDEQTQKQDIHTDKKM